MSTSASSPDPDAPVGIRHSLVEDIYALLIGSALIVLGLVCLRAAGLVTGGIAGVALLVSYVVPLPPGVLFTLINLPFFLFARSAMGTAFMVKTMIVSTGVTLLSLGAPAVLRLAMIQPLFAALFGGTVIGMGVLSLARHNAGVGGTGVLTLWLYKKRGWNAGRTQLTIDACIMLVSLLAVSPGRVLLSAVSAAAISGVLIAFHRPGRYTGH
ncbi:YitT family protein [Sphingomonas nostoxanthinifaciens]|uniref:YitT family protein n=1 Tax=Sphingomonas nostoxanthinifaciens TaxID=2872652 RepID=UPI001CC1CDCC|nr:YitT family protein [Sphingomonas nostoxanthinifaciens]